MKYRNPGLTVQPCKISLDESRDTRQRLPASWDPLEVPATCFARVFVRSLARSLRFTHHVDAFGVSPEIAAPLAGGDGGAQVIVVVLVQRVERLRVGIADEIIQVLRLAETGVLGAGGRMVVRGERGWKVRWLEVGGSRQRGAPVVGHAAAVSVSPVSVVMGTGIGRRVPAAQRGNAPMASQTVLLTSERSTVCYYRTAIGHDTGLIIRPGEVLRIRSN